MSAGRPELEAGGYLTWSLGPEEQVTWVISPEMSPGVVGKSAWRQSITDTFPPHIRDPGRLGHVVLSFGWCHFRARRTRCT